VSQSPLDETPAQSGSDYLKNWDALGMKISRGFSFSGRERNCLFLNLSGGRFANVSAVTGFDLIDDGRAIAKVDWDQDGDLDIWIANRTGPRVRFLQNEIETKNQFLALRLEGRYCNRDAIGARVEVYLGGESPRTLIETLRAGQGFLSQSSKWMHFGLGASERVERVFIRWPDNSYDEFTDIKPNRRYKIVQGNPQAIALPTTSRNVDLKRSIAATPVSTQEARVVLAHRPKFPELFFDDFQGKQHSLQGRSGEPVLLNLWASWCLPCLKELSDISREYDSLRGKRLRVVALCTDSLGEQQSPDLTSAREYLAKSQLPFPTGIATTNVVAGLNTVHGRIFYKERPLPLPTSFLFDQQGRLAVIYRGPLSVEQLYSDLDLLGLDAEDIEAAALPFPGKFINRKISLNSIVLAQAYREDGYLDNARTELDKFFSKQLNSNNANSLTQRERLNLAAAYKELAKIEQAMDMPNERVAALKKAARLRPDSPDLLVALAIALFQKGDVAGANNKFESTLQLSPDHAENWNLVGQAWMVLGDTKGAIRYFKKGVELDPDSINIRFNLAAALQLRGDAGDAIKNYQYILSQQPSAVNAANNLAWLYGTHADKTIRNGKEAVRLSLQACRISKNNVPAFLGTLGAAYAETGNYEEAITATQRAIQLAAAMGQERLVPDLKERLALFQSKKPYREPAVQNVP